MSTTPPRIPLPPLLAVLVDSVAQEWDGCQCDAPGGEIDVGAAIRSSFPVRWASLIATDKEGTASHLLPLREGEIMGAYMDFDRTADKSWNTVEYLTRFGAYISALTASNATFSADIGTCLAAGNS